jgi:REP element-mobilizing transposase RayT
MFRKKNCFYSGEEINVFVAGNNHLHTIVDLLSSAIIRHEMRLKSKKERILNYETSLYNKKERIINKNYAERTGLLRTVGQNGDQSINNYSRETT